MNITELEDNQVFVFGSNEAGRHGKGAALQAKKWGAKYGKGTGLHGKTYAIPTKDKDLKVLSIGKIKKYVDEFIAFATANPTLTFLVTKIGCGLAGYSTEDIAPLFSDVPANIILPNDFKK